MQRFGDPAGTEARYHTLGFLSTCFVSVRYWQSSRSTAFKRYATEKAMIEAAVKEGRTFWLFVMGFCCTSTLLI